MRRSPSKTKVRYYHIRARAAMILVYVWRGFGALTITCAESTLADVSFFGPANGKQDPARARRRRSSHRHDSFHRESDGGRDDGRRRDRFRHHRHGAQCPRSRPLRSSHPGCGCRRHHAVRARARGRSRADQEAAQSGRDEHRRAAREPRELHGGAAGGGVCPGRRARGMPHRACRALHTG